MTLDSLLEKSKDDEEYKVFFNLLDLTTIKNKMASYKNSIRQDAYDYIAEDNFKNLHWIVEKVNEVLQMPTEIVGCEFVNCKAQAEQHDELNKDFVLLFDVIFALKST